MRGSRRDTPVLVSSVYRTVFFLNQMARTNVVSIVLFVEVALVIVAQVLFIAFASRASESDACEIVVKSHFSSAQRVFLYLLLI